MKRRRYVVASVVALAGFGALFAVLPSQGAGTKVTIAGFRYRPASIKIEAGGAITVHNDTKLVHTATCFGCPVDSKDIQPGTIRTITFPKAGTYQLYCRYHGQSRGMIARLVVTPSG
ncbi:MAG: cupredoxin domain-containing protein [Actinomycetota bacterium]